jgi:serine/threonine protein kinase
MLPSETAELLIQGTKALQKLFENGIIHNDIKPANVLFDENQKKLYIADFGCASFPDKVEDYIAGTSLFISPVRYNPTTYKPSVQDDRYSWVFSMAYILGGMKRLINPFKPNQNPNKKFPDVSLDKCFARFRTKDCRDLLAKTASEIFADSGYDLYDESQVDITKMNLKTLLTKILIFDGFNYSQEEVVNCMKRNKELLAKCWAKFSSSDESVKKMVGLYSIVRDPIKPYVGVEKDFWDGPYKKFYEWKDNESCSTLI